MDDTRDTKTTQILNIGPVTRSGMRFLALLYGLSETGKTLSALKIAAGLEPDPTKRLLLDTEGGQRGRAYVDQIEGGYLYATLTPPFTPERYMEAMREVEAHSNGITVTVVDSVSHAWFAEGGVLEMVENATERNDLAKWAKPKRRLSKMTQKILTSDMHVILCARARQVMVEIIGENGRKTYQPGPILPIIEKGLRFDMTVVAHMLGDGQFTVTRPDGKCAGVLRPVFAARDLMDEGMGGLLRSWLESEGGKTPERRRLDRDIMEAAELGKDALQAFWASLDRDKRAMVVGNIDNLKSVAKAADSEAERLKAEQERERLEREADRDPFLAADGEAAPKASTIDVQQLGAPADRPAPPVSAPPGQPTAQEPAKPAAGPAPAQAPQPAARADTAPQASPAAAIPADFWARESYELPPKRKGNKFDWLAWEASIIGLAAAAPNEDAALKLREENSRNIAQFSLVRPDRIAGLKTALASARAAA